MDCIFACGAQHAVADLLRGIAEALSPSDPDELSAAVERVGRQLDQKFPRK
ncbi:hypothetical protein [Mycobacterium sp. NPDC050041]|uniref:hypothetical protein n=1 Tax=Mycobacterium sp. NPDC050041 TaxID=3364293 RepID=UPI003C2CA327